MKNKKFNTLRILTANAWVWLSYENEKLGTTTDCSQYKAAFLGRSYSSTVVAITSDEPEHLQFNGHYGVLWLEAIYECERDGCFSFEDMQDMQAAIIAAEENLLKIGMPFVPDYKFHGKNTSNKIRRNDKLRRIYCLEEQEKVDWENK